MENRANIEALAAASAYRTAGQDFCPPVPPPPPRD